MFKHLPFKVVAIIILEIIIGIIMLLEGLTLILLEGLSGIIVTPSYHISLFLKVTYISTSLLSVVIAYGLWKGKNWSWRAAFFFALISAIGNGVHFIGAQHHRGIIPLILNIVLIYYLTRPQILKYYKIGSKKDPEIYMKGKPPL